MREAVVVPDTILSVYASPAQTRDAVLSFVRSQGLLPPYREIVRWDGGYMIEGELNPCFDQEEE